MAPGVMISYSHPLSKTKHFQSTWCQESSEYCHFLPFTSLNSLPWQMVAAFLFINSMNDEVLNYVCGRRITNDRKSLWKYEYCEWVLFFSRIICFFLTVPLSVTTNHVTHPGEEPHPYFALQQTGNLSSRGRRFRQHRGTAPDNQPAARAQRYETSASAGFLLSVVGQTDSDQQIYIKKATSCYPVETFNAQNNIYTKISARLAELNVHYASKTATEDPEEPANGSTPSC